MSTMNQPRSHEDTKFLEPELRFTEFNGAWAETKIGKLSQTITSGSRDWAQYYSNTGSKFIRMTNLDRSSIYLNLSDLKYVSVNSSSSDGKRTSLEKGDILISITAELGKIGWVDDGLGEAFINQHTALVRINEALSYSKFVAYYLHTPRTNKLINRLNDSGAKAGLNLSTIKSIPVQKPSINEQQKIADFLSSVDKKIEQLTEKYRLLTEYKKGVMQQIFTQEIRFKDNQGNDYPEWEEKRLGSISKRKTEKNKDETQRLVLTNSAVQGIVSQTDYFDKDIANQNNLGGYYIVEQDDFVYNPRISVSAPVGPIKRNHLSTGVMSPLYSVFAIIKGSKNFFERYFETNLWHRYMNQIANFGARHDRMNVTTADFYNMPMPFPCLEEQQKIANFLTKIDQKIDQAWSTLEQTKGFKKSLLQKMFV